MSGITHGTIQTSGINTHIAEAGGGPLVLLPHAFSELWYSWRRQLPALPAAGYQAVTPDVRGRGHWTQRKLPSSAPSNHSPVAGPGSW